MPIRTNFVAVTAVPISVNFKTVYLQEASANPSRSYGRLVNTEKRDAVAILSSTLKDIVEAIVKRATIASGSEIRLLEIE